MLKNIGFEGRYVVEFYMFPDKNESSYITISDLLLLLLFLQN